VLLLVVVVVVATGMSFVLVENEPPSFVRGRGRLPSFNVLQGRREANPHDVPTVLFCAENRIREEAELGDAMFSASKGESSGVGADAALISANLPSTSQGLY
jgi:hypothetical protein